MKFYAPFYASTIRTQLLLKNQIEMRGKDAQMEALQERKPRLPGY